MRMLDSVTDLYHKRRDLPRSQTALTAVLQEGSTLDKLHDHVRMAEIVRADIEDSRDIPMPDARERSALALEVCPHGDRRYKNPHDRDAAADRRTLLAAKDRPHAAFAQHSRHAERPDLHGHACPAVGTILGQADILEVKHWADFVDGQKLLKLTEQRVGARESPLHPAASSRSTMEIPPNPTGSSSTAVSCIPPPRRNATRRRALSMSTERMAATAELMK